MGRGKLIHLICLRYQADSSRLQVVLASSSPVFRAMFTNGLKECGMEVVPIEGIHPRVSVTTHFIRLATGM